jgi:hypothetical protein
MSKKTGTAATKKKASLQKSRVNANEKRIAAALTHLRNPKPATPQAAKVIDLLPSWLEDESVDDEQTWPELKRNLDRERKRTGSRSLFDA